MQEYKRDKRSPVPKNVNVSKVMSRNRAQDSKPEMTLRKALYKAGIRGYRTNLAGIPGRPDIAFTSKKVAIFVHGCFWHRCPNCNLSLPKRNSDFWQAKFKRNVERDKEKALQLEYLGWKILIVWECELKLDINVKVRRIKDNIQRTKSNE